MQKPTIMIAIAAILLSGVVASSCAYAETGNNVNTSIRKNNEDAKEVNANIQNMKAAMKMNHQSDSVIQHFIEQQQIQHRDLEKKYSFGVNDTENWVKSKMELAQQASQKAFEQRTQYIDSTVIEQNKILFHMMETHHQSRINIDDASNVTATNISYYR